MLRDTRESAHTIPVQLSTRIKPNQTENHSAVQIWDNALERNKTKPGQCHLDHPKQLKQNQSNTNLSEDQRTNMRARPPMSSRVKPVEMLQAPP